MGLLSLGTPMPWSEAKKHADHVRKHGIIQFLNIWNRIKTRRRDHLLWGDEVEYMVVKFDHETKTAKLSLDAFEALQKLEGMELDAKNNNQQFPSSWKPEYGRYMLEGTPGAPYGSTLKDLLLVEDNMVSRRLLAKEQMAGYEGQDILTLTNFPRLGCEDCWFGESIDGECKKPNLIDGKSKSLFIPDVAINPHARFRTLTGNIRERRGAKVFINIPIYNDINTPKPFLEPLPPSLSSAPADLVQSIREESNSLDKPIAPLSEIKSKTLPSVIPDALPDSIYLDAMCFGMGCSCLQVTFQACCVEEARTLYDQLAVVSPIMLALTAAAPIFRGFLSNIDARWDVIAASVDDRTKQETGIRPLITDKFRIHKSRYDSISHYLSSGPSYSGGCSGPRVGRRGENDGYADFYRSVYDDLDAGYDEQIYRKLLEEGLDTSLAKHYAHLFIRDPLVIFEELLDQDDKISSDHFENIQSTNWQTMRFKPPPATAENIGWRVEFRSMEIQLTDFENAAFSIFVVLLTRTILSFDLNFYICLSKVDENMGRAKKMDAALKEKFWFRKNVFGKLPEPSSDSDDDEDQPKESGGCGCDDSLDVEDDIRRGKGRKSLDGVSNSSKDHLRSSFIGDEDEAVELTINEIINGKDGEFPGLATLISSYLQSMPLDHRVSSGLEKYLSFIRKKASGEIPTTASWIRNFVGGHPAYKKDSVVSDEVNYDLLMKIKTMGDENKGPGL